jgi:hypothetical protein
MGGEICYIAKKILYRKLIHACIKPAVQRRFF